MLPIWWAFHAPSTSWQCDALTSIQRKGGNVQPQTTRLPHLTSVPIWQRTKTWMSQWALCYNKPPMARTFTWIQKRPQEAVPAPAKTIHGRLYLFRIYRARHLLVTHFEHPQTNFIPRLSNWRLITMPRPLYGTDSSVSRNYGVLLNVVWQHMWQVTRGNLDQIRTEPLSLRLCTESWRFVDFFIYSQSQGWSRLNAQTSQRPHKRIILSLNG